MSLASLVAWFAFVLPAAAPAEEHPLGGEHPLAGVLALAERRFAEIPNEIHDYTCTLLKHEQVDGVLLDQEQIFVKVRHARSGPDGTIIPFAVYARYLSPARLAGREAIYVEGRNGNQVIARRGGQRVPYITTATDPRGPLAMNGNRYPITEMGLRNLIYRVGQEGLQLIRSGGDLEVKFYPQARVNERICTAIQISHRTRQAQDTFAQALVFVDDERQIAIRYAAYDWPDEPGGPLKLVEEYTYLDLKLNIGLTDWDFDHHNEQYQFLKDFEP